jgi:hypothetical protein
MLPTLPIGQHPLWNGQGSPHLTPKRQIPADWFTKSSRRCPLSEEHKAQSMGGDTREASEEGWERVRWILEAGFSPTNYRSSSRTLIRGADRQIDRLISQKAGPDGI